MSCKIALGAISCRIAPVDVFLNPAGSDRIRWFETMRDWKETAEFVHREVCMSFWNLQRVEVLEFCCFWKRETVCL